MTSSPAPPSWSGGSQRDAIAELAYNNLMLQPEAPLVPLSPMADNPCVRVADRRLLFALLFAHEVDVLEIALQQHLGYADVMLAESVQTHNVVNRELKPLLWQRLKSTPFKPVGTAPIVGGMHLTNYCNLGPPLATRAFTVVTALARDVLNPHPHLTLLSAHSPGAQPTSSSRTTMPPSRPTGWQRSSRSAQRLLPPSTSGAI